MAPSRKRPSRLHPVTVALLLLLLLGGGAIFWNRLRPDPSTGEAPAGEPVAVSTSKPSPSVAPPPSASDVVLSNEVRVVPGEPPAEWLYFRAPEAESVRISGSWNGWAVKHPLRRVDGVWAFHIGSVDAPFGTYEFKFIVDGDWEGGANRLLHLNETGQLERPPRVVAQSLIEDPHNVRVVLRSPPETPDAVSASLGASYEPLRLRWRLPEHAPVRSGYRLMDGRVEFVFQPASYDMAPSAVRTVSVAGPFSGWNAEAAEFRLRPSGDGAWTLDLPEERVLNAAGGEPVMFKFVVNGEWKEPPAGARNAMFEPGTPHRNLSISPAERPELWIQTAKPMNLANPPALILKGLHEKTIRLRPTPGVILDTLHSPKPMGATLDREENRTTYRLFAPRATAVRIGFFDGPFHTTPEGEAVEPVSSEPMARDADGVWEHQRDGLDIGQFYAYQVEGPAGDGEGFTPGVWLGDPYAKAVSLAEGNSLVIDLDDVPVQPEPEPRVAWEDMILYETHVRHFTWDPSSGVPETLRGNYLGMLASEGTGTGLDHLKDLGVNVIQLMPIHEFNNGFLGRHDWGYATCFFFAPESSYAQRPLEGSQVAEFKQLVHGLHQRGFAVFLDVVYNHIGGVNVFNSIDRKYYFRLNPDLTKQNFSGVGNDVASERPMMRRLIRESVLFWVEEYGIDGFRFDLGELIDDVTLSQIEAEIREKHPHVVLHSEPWSFRGHHKDFIGDTSWGAWNDQFREPAKRFVAGGGDKDALKKAIRGSVESWARHPLQSVNYMESHDDNSLVDELSANPGMDGRKLSARDERIHKMAATLIFSSLGTPMITEGQAFLRSKHGIRNTYNRGDELNALRWDERERPHARQVLDYYREMIAFRLSDAGRALRVADAPTLDYTRFIDTDRQDALGWIINANGERPGVPAVMVLMNAGSEARSFQVDLPDGAWKQIGDGDRVVPEGLPNAPAVSGGQRLTLTVPSQTAWIYRNGF